MTTNRTPRPAQGPRMTETARVKAVLTRLTDAELVELLARLNRHGGDVKLLRAARSELRMREALERLLPGTAGERP